jgi:tripartite-type tricarboxylate transporter receptor subunit TctC
MTHRIAARLAAGVLAGLALVTSATAQDWKPSGPINIIVPWGAGGSTDQVTRVTAPIIAEALGVDVVVVNQPGASGSIGTQAVLDAPRDGLTWTANAVANNATYAVTGLLEDTNIDDWHIYLSVANAPLISVPADSEFQDFGQLLEALRTRGSDITVGTAGITSSGGMAISTLAFAGGFDYRMITYDGGGPAAIAAASGEVMMTTQLAVEQTELVRGGRLRALAVMSPTPLVVEGVPPIPSITDWLDMDLAPDYFGILIPRGVPDEVISTIDAIWRDQVTTSEALRIYAETFGAVFDPSYGDAARARAMPVVIEEACGAETRGEAVNPASSIGIDCETRTEISRP